MSRLTDLLRQVRRSDAQLARDLEAGISDLANRRTFGLVFEAHQPEAVELPGRSIRRGDKVRILAPRGELNAEDSRLWRVHRIQRAAGQRLAHLQDLEDDEAEVKVISTENLIVVAEFNDRIYPGLIETGRVERSEDKPFHTVINAENYHALEMLTYTHRHSIDAIYIDPPYNTGAKDWKYNNNYVEADDDYRHSKWLAFMERRLKVARELLNPDNSVLIVTIDEKEYLRLGLLLEQTFPEARIQMVSTVINPSGSSRATGFSRADEYIFFVMIGENDVAPWSTDMLRIEETAKPVRWDGLMRTGGGSDRSDRPGLFYPIFFSTETGRLHSIGSPIAPDQSRKDIGVPEGTFPVWPLTGERERRWRVGHVKARELAQKGYLKFGPWEKGNDRRTIYYLPSGAAKRVDLGETQILSRDENGTVVLADEVRKLRPMSVWNMRSHSATEWGTGLVRAMLPDRKFPFPKSLYAVEDALRFFVKDKPEAKILDFFAGSGTSAHAVMRLNKQDGGHRQSISVTNNEVSAEEQRKLRKAGLRPGDPEWEALGICDYVTKPRVTAAITGKTPEGEPIKGKYRFTDEFPMVDGFEENAAFFTLTYETPLSVRHHRAFERIAPMLWLKAGAQGRIICDLGAQRWDVAEAYAVLEDFDRADEFMAALQERSDELVVYLITDDDAAFQMACRELAAHHRPVRLYESYLHNFQLNIEGTV